MAELRLPLRLGAGSGGMETGPPPAEPEERGQCCCVLDSRTTHTGVAVGQLPASAPRHAPVLSACRLLGGLVPAPPFAVFSAQGPVRSRSSRIHSADGRAGPGDQEHKLVPGEWGAPRGRRPTGAHSSPGRPAPGRVLRSSPQGPSSTSLGLAQRWHPHLSCVPRWGPGGETGGSLSLPRRFFSWCCPTPQLSGKSLPTPQLSQREESEIDRGFPSGPCAPLLPAGLCFRIRRGSSLQEELGKPFGSWTPPPPSPAWLSSRSTVAGSAGPPRAPRG